MDMSLLAGEQGGIFAMGLITGGGAVLVWAQKTLVAQANARISKLEGRVKELEDERAEEARKRIEKLETLKGEI